MSVYNGMPYLKDATESILNQTYKNVEFIIVDDASTDGSWKYLKSTNDKRIKLIRNKKNLGLASSLNKALKVARGDYIARMDADDISLPKRLDTQVRFLDKNTNIDLCGTWVNLINKEGKIVGQKRYPTSDIKIKRVLPFYNPIIHPTLMIKTDVIHNTGYYDPSYDFAEDYELLVRSRKKFTMANIPKVTLKLRIGHVRRSTQQMIKMDKLDLKIKMRILKENFSATAFIAVIKKVIAVYLFPIKLKLQIAKFLNLS